MGIRKVRKSNRLKKSIRARAGAVGAGVVGVGTVGAGVLTALESLEPETLELLTSEPMQHHVVLAGSTSGSLRISETNYGAGAVGPLEPSELAPHHVPASPPIDI
jgi:hypothetical protein